MTLKVYTTQVYMDKGIMLGWLQGGLKMITGPPTPALPSLEATAVRRLLYQLSDHLVPGAAWHTGLH